MKRNYFCISTPSQMINALEFVSHYGLGGDYNVVLISCCNPKFVKQITSIGKNVFSEYEQLFDARFWPFPVSYYNKMPLKLIRLFVSKRNASRILLVTGDKDRLILGNYSNFISQYCTQIFKGPIHVLDDGSATLNRQKKRDNEIRNNIPFFEFNQKRKGLLFVKLIMGFKDYKIPSELNFFSNYSFHVSGQDSLTLHGYENLKKCYEDQGVDESVFYFVGSPISETGYVSLQDELRLIYSVRDQHPMKKMIYICHRLDSRNKISKLTKSVMTMEFDCPLELALAQQEKRPSIIVGFFSSALGNFASITSRRAWIYSKDIDAQMYLSEQARERARSVYSSYRENPFITVI